MKIGNLAVLIRVMNIITGIGLIVISVLSIIDIKQWFTFRIFLIPCPFFVGFFGICLLAAEFKVKVVLKKLSFLQTLIGRGLFNIFLSSLAFWFLQNQEVLAWISALVLFITGLIYIIFGIGWGKKLQQNGKQDDNVERQPQGRQNLI